MSNSNSWNSLFPQGRPFIKMQGLHNHFVIVDARQENFQPVRAETQRICDVRTGVGADQLLVIQSPTPKGSAEGAYAFMRIINIDGLDAEACGNATRCVGRLLLEEAGLDKVTLETEAGLLECKRQGTDQVRVDMGKIQTQWHEIPLARTCDTLHVPVSNGPLVDPVALNIGNPHLIYFVDNLALVDMEAFSPEIQKNPLFPALVNVGAVEIIRDDYIRLSVYERPGMLTAACGSGACVAAKAMQLRGLTQKNNITVEMAGGNIEIELLENGHAAMTGPAQYCFSGNLSGSEEGTM